MDRSVDIRPFIDLRASFSRYPGGRIEVEITLTNHGPRELTAAEAVIACDSGEWRIPLGSVASESQASWDRRLPRHDACDGYTVAMGSASW